MEEQSSRRSPWYDALLPFALVLGLVMLLNIDMQTVPADVEEQRLLDQWLEVLVVYLAALAEIAAAGVIGVAILRGLVSFGRTLFRAPRGQFHHTEDIRLELGRALVLGLEFTVASDILRTAIAPSREDLLVLGVVVMLRTLLNNFLEREIHDAERRRARRDGNEEGALEPDG